MIVIAINGSPRKQGNTAILLNKALEGATSKGAQTELIHLYDLNFKGCTSCLECKLKGGKSYGRCSYRDELTSVLSKIEVADAIIVGAPNYLGTISGEMKSFLERLVYPYFMFTPDGQAISLFPRKIPSGFIHTLGAGEERVKSSDIGKHMKWNEMLLGIVFGSVESLVATDSPLAEDWSKYTFSSDLTESMKRHNAAFSKHCEKAFTMGAEFAQKKQEMP
jgi:multimeric flavodoxin WrbA